MFDQIQEICIDLSIENSSNEAETQIATATVLASGAKIRGKETSANMYASIDILYDKLLIQLKRHKEKMRIKKRGFSAIKQILPLSLDVEPPTKEKEPRRYVPKPMDTEDAAPILEDENLDFLVFRNLKERICVIYSDQDNTAYGLIET